MGNLTLNDLANNQGNTTEKKAVSIAEMNLPPEKKEADNANDFLSQQFGALDGLVQSAKTAREKYDDSNLDNVVNENLDNYDPTEDEGPVMAASDTADTTVASKPNPVAVPEGDAGITSHLHAEIEANAKAAEEETTPEEVVKARQEAKNEKEFNSIFNDTSSNDDADKELLDIINDTEPDVDTDAEDAKLSEEEEKEIVEKYQAELGSLFAKHNAVDTEGFAVSRKSISMSKLLNVKEPDKRIADWVQTTAKRPFSTVEYSGLDLQKINPDSRRNRNSINTIKDIYRTIYNHLVGATKDGFESWLKSTPYRDVLHFYFGAYKATFGDLNVITYQCPDTKCNNIFIAEQPFESMYEIDDEKAKEEFDKIFNGDTTLAVDFQEEIKPVSPQFAVGLIEPSIYSVEIEPLLINDETKTKYSRIIGLLPFIKGLYYIDRENKAYVPIDEGAVSQDIAKTVKHKLAIYYKILGSLTNDQLATLQVYAYNYRQQPEHVKFFNPECTCPKCGKIVPKQEVRPDTMLFNRAQSPLVANLSEK